HVIDDVQYPKPPATGELVMDKVQAPAGIGPGCHEDRCPRADRPAPCPTLANSQTLFPIQPVDPVDARWLTLAPQQDMQPAIAEPAPLIGKLAQTAAQLRLRRTPRLVADHLAIGIDDRAGPTLRQSHYGLQMRDGFALSGGPYHFFDKSSRRAAASNIWSASSFFSRAFSSSRCRSRRASETSSPPYFAFQL